MNSDDAAATLAIDKEMGISHAEFFRILPAALPGFHLTLKDGIVDANDGERRVEISLAPEGRRRIALLELPVTRVRLVLRGYGNEEAGAVVTRFDRAFQRGGG